MQAKPDDVGLSSERLARVNAWARRWVDDGKLPCLITMLARHGKIVHFDVYGMADVKRETARRAGHDLSLLLDDQAADLDSDHDAV